MHRDHEAAVGSGPPTWEKITDPAASHIPGNITSLTTSLELMSEMLRITGVRIGFEFVLLASLNTEFTTSDFINSDSSIQFCPPAYCKGKLAVGIMSKSSSFTLSDALRLLQAAPTRRRWARS